MEQWERLFAAETPVFDETMRTFFSGKRAAVTGGGGSIGSELCRQLVALDVSALLIFDIAENSSYELSLQLKQIAPQCEVEVAIGSVRDKERIEQVFLDFRPELVCHAAAHKHVPLMEDAPGEAVKNNVLGTENAADAAIKAGAKQFLLISTDKAVAPKNVMGATKRLCELIMAKKNGLGATRFSSVRFGNVFGSSGSVVPLFRRQIAAGGPVFVTHKDATRYFMTIPEAVFLVLCAMTLQQGEEIFVLDMGEAVSIDALARKLIREAGLQPERDIEICYTGLRPGEKLHEKLILTGGKLTPTKRPRIYTAEETYSSITTEQLELLYKAGPSRVKETLKELLPEYQPEQ